MRPMEIPTLNRRSPDSHKGDFGRVLIVGGSRGMAGSVSLAGMAAGRSGAGLTTLAVPDCCLETVAGFDPNYMTVPLPDDREGRLANVAAGNILDLAQTATSIAIGPGLGRSDDVTEVVSTLYRDFAGPMVVDADALNALASRPQAIATDKVRVLTPHIGEFRRLVGESEFTIDQCRERICQFARDNRLVVVLKGNRSLVTDGNTMHQNETGNPGMATGGSGDVLTGIIAALLSRRELSALQAVALSVHIHGLAGDLAARAFGETSMVANDIKDMVGMAFRSHDRKRGFGFHAK